MYHMRDFLNQIKFLGICHNALKSVPDKKASNIVYGLHFLQVWPYEHLSQIQTDVCIELSLTFINHTLTLVSKVWF